MAMPSSTKISMEKEKSNSRLNPSQEHNIFPPSVPQTDKVPLRYYTDLLLSSKWIIMAFVIGSVGFVYLISILISPTYQATTMIMVSKANLDQTSNYDTILIGENLARTYTEMITSENILGEVAQQLGISKDPGELGNITATPIVNSQMIVINVDHSDPVLVAKIANTLVSVFSKEIDRAQLESAAIQDKALETQMQETEGQIARLQEEIKAQSEDGYNQQLERINKIIEDLRKQIDQVDQGVVSLSQARKNELSSLLSLYQQQYVLLNVTGPKLGSQDPESEQILADLDQYRRIYNLQTESYWSLKTTRLQNTVAVIQVDKAVVPSSPTRPNLLINLAVGFFAGLLLSAIYIFTTKLSVR